MNIQWATKNPRDHKHNAFGRLKIRAMCWKPNVFERFACRYWTYMFVYVSVVNGREYIEEKTRTASDAELSASSWCWTRRCIPARILMLQTRQVAIVRAGEAILTNDMTMFDLKNE
jgi:hypothetical protein